VTVAAWTRSDGDGPHALFTGGVHGDEYEAMAALRALIGELASRTIRGRVTIIPVANAPAFDAACRTGPDGMDLARTFPGKTDGTVTERIAAELTEHIRSADFYIDLHSGGASYFVYPLVGYTLHPDARVLAAQRRMARAFGLPLIWGTDPRLNGRSLSAARDAGVPAIYAEYLGGGRLSDAGVRAYMRGCRRVLAECGLIGDDGEREPDGSLSQGRMVEDAREGSGHLQTRHTAPIDGFFEPRARLGARLGPGEPLGEIVDALGTHRITIPAAHGGAVIAIRVLPRVARGESVGVVLDEIDGREPLELPEWPRDPL